MPDAASPADALAALHAENQALRAQLARLDQDLRQQALLASAMRRSHDRYRALIAALHEGIVVHDQTGEILECNPPWAR